MNTKNFFSNCVAGPAVDGGTYRSWTRKSKTTHSHHLGWSLTVLAALLGSSVASALPARAEASSKPSDLAQKLVAAAIERTRQRVIYDPAYRPIAYPGGDVPLDRGVCTDVVIRSYRALGIDLQQHVHLDMRRAFRAYPKRWGLRRPDTNIDHRRVPNLRRFFIRKGQSLPVSLDGHDYQVGDLVTWDLAKSGPSLHPATAQHPDRLTRSRTPAYRHCFRSKKYRWSTPVDRPQHRRGNRVE